jgi:quercetin dioxygenase-like cupin family protein
MKVIHDGSTVSKPADPTRFTGRVWRTEFIVPVEEERLAGLRFDYEPAARSHWHIHQCEQAIVVVHGHGLVAWQGLASPVELAVGDWWHVQPEIPHWHGATPNAPFAHLAVTAGGSTTWLHEVSDADYQTRPARQHTQAG